MPTRFDHAGGSVIFADNPRRPGRDHSLVQPVAASTGGVSFGFDPYARERLHRLDWPAMSSANRASLETFFDTVADGMAELFDWTDAAGTVRSVRFAQAALEFVEVAQARYAVSVDLLEA